MQHRSHILFQIKHLFRTSFGLRFGLRWFNPKDKVALEFGLSLIVSSKTEFKIGFKPK